MLETYLNTIYFGRGAYGIESAAQRLLRQARVGARSGRERHACGHHPLAVTLRRPLCVGRDDTKRRNVVLVADARTGLHHLAGGARREQRAARLRGEQGSRQGGAVLRRVREAGPHRHARSRTVYAGGLRVYTSLEPDLQALAEKAATQLSAPGDPEIALVSVRPADGKVLAMVGGRDFKANQFNLATQGRRQPGSAFKPFVLVTALQEGIRPDQVFESAPYSVPVKDGVWTVQNYENRFTEGSMTLQAATDYSVNAVYARLIMLIGPEKVVKTAKRMGITTPLVADPAIALGGLKYGVSPLEMASSYATSPTAASGSCPAASRW